MEDKYGVNLSFSLNTIGIITWIVFLVLKLCNQTNPDFSWLTWFWVWFPLWLPFAIDAAIILIMLVVAAIFALIHRNNY